MEDYPDASDVAVSSALLESYAVFERRSHAVTGHPLSVTHPQGLCPLPSVTWFLLQFPIFLSSLIFLDVPGKSTAWCWEAWSLQGLLNVGVI